MESVYHLYNDLYPHFIRNVPVPVRSCRFVPASRAPAGSVIVPAMPAPVVCAKASPANAWANRKTVTTRMVILTLPTSSSAARGEL